MGAKGLLTMVLATIIAAVPILTANNGWAQTLEEQAAAALGEPPVPPLKPAGLRELLDFSFLPQQMRTNRQMPERSVLRLKSQIASCLRATPRMPKKDAPAALKAGPLVVDFAPVAPGFAVLTFVGRVSAAKQSDVESLIPIVTQLDAKGRPLNSYVGTMPYVTDDAFFCAAELNHEAVSFVITFSRKNHEAVKAEWIDEKTQSVRSQVWAIDRKALVSSQAAKAQAGPIVRPKTSDRHTHEWGTRDGKHTRGNFKSFEGGVLRLTNSAGDVVAIKFRELDADAKKHLQGILKAERQKELQSRRENSAQSK